MSQIQVHRIGKGPRFSCQFLEKFLDFCPQSWKSSQIYGLGPNKGPDFSSQSPEKVLDLGLGLEKGHRCSCQFLENVLRIKLVPGKRPRFLSSVLSQKAASSQKRFLIFVQSPGKVPRFMPQVLMFQFPSIGKGPNIGPGPFSSQVSSRKDFCPRPGNLMLQRIGKGPRQVAASSQKRKVLDFCPQSWIQVQRVSQIYVPRFLGPKYVLFLVPRSLKMSWFFQVLASSQKRFLIFVLSPSSQIYALGPNKKVLDLDLQIQVLRLGKGPRFFPQSWKAF